MHENFSAATLQNDIAIIVPEGTVNETNGVKPACITKEMYKANEICVSLGWGPTAFGNLLIIVYQIIIISFPLSKLRRWNC